MINISKAEYEKMQSKLRLLKEIEKIDIDLLRQFKNSLDDVKAGRIRRVC